jgi:YegS/Rv2252/BmrU family lipid kinase
VGASPQRVACIVNPHSAAGKTERQWPTLELALASHVDVGAVYKTQGRGHATELTAEALRAGYETIVSVGGDGTHHEVVNGFFNNGEAINPNAALAIMPCGTGSDMARMLGIHSTTKAIAAIAGGKTQRADLGRAQFTLFDGAQATRLFVNVADFGAGGAVAERIDQGPKWLGGKLAYLWAVLYTVLTYRSPLVRIRINGDHLEGKFLNIIMAKGAYYGGGIHVAPEARLDSGVFEVFVLKDMSIATALWYLPRFYNGTFVAVEALVSRYQATSIMADSNERVVLDLDGEAPGQLPVTADLIPGALNLIVP